MYRVSRGRRSHWGAIKIMKYEIFPTLVKAKTVVLPWMAWLVSFQAGISSSIPRVCKLSASWVYLYISHVPHMMKSSLLGIPFIHHVSSAKSRKGNSDQTDSLLEILGRMGGKLEFLFAVQCLQNALGLNLCKRLFQVTLFSVQAFKLPNLQRCGNGEGQLNSERKLMWLLRARAIVRA